MGGCGMTKVLKQIIVEQPLDIHITEVTLLSVEEYDKCKANIPAISKRWWLSSPGRGRAHATLVRCDGLRVYDFVNYTCFVVRPALRIKSPEPSNLSIGDRFNLAGYTWTMIDDGLALLDGYIGQCAFREDWKASDANDYEKSDVKKYLKRWATENGIEVADSFYPES